MKANQIDAKKMHISAASLAPDWSVRKATPSDNTERTAHSGTVVETIFCQDHGICSIPPPQMLWISDAILLQVLDLNVNIAVKIKEGKLFSYSVCTISIDKVISCCVMCFVCSKIELWFKTKTAA